ncbi:glutathione S-transferase family protein (plasmid) [Catenovulum sp. SX2]|uniref:glutathione S-transferase family protein n=1 Tax=Catenovulum sp. SX2 TaxID=3398614 RepID=UPI003F85D0D3
MKLYHIFAYDRSLKVRWLANEINLALQIIKLDVAERQHKTEPFKTINPHGLIPTVEKENGEVLFEAGAICLDICREHAPHLINEQDSQFMQWLFYFASSLDTLSGGIIGLHVFGEKEQVRETLERRIPHQLAAINQHLTGKDYWYKDKFSLLDIFAWQNLAYLYVDGQLKDYPILISYLENLAKRPALANLKPEGLLKP